jgi:hypothetical protein
MKSHELAKILLKNEDREVDIFWDGGIRGKIEGIVLDNGEEEYKLDMEVEDGRRVVIVGRWDIYRRGKYRYYAEDKIIYAVKKVYEEVIEL